MVNTEKNIYIQETEVKPNKYACYVLVVTIVWVAICWLINEIGLFRVGSREMRIGSAVPLIFVPVPLLIMLFKPSMRANPAMKYVVMGAAAIFTLTITTLLTFHTTIMLLFPIFIAMLYRSRPLGIVAVACSVTCTVISPILGYILGTWDVPLFQELILIATGGTAEIVDPTYTVTWVGVFKILLYIVGPKLMMVGSCSLLLFYVIRLGDEHVKNQILLHNMSHHDNLTGLYNQNYFKELVEKHRFKGQVGIIFFDVNGLKTANDSKGHEYGDLLLSRCAKSILDICQEDKDAGFRVGGDEFLLLRENTDEADIREKLRQWESSIAGINKENVVLGYDLICSMASGYIVGEAKDIDELVRRADEYMYRNKALMKSVEM